jgi:D-alanine-D-alanine ligase-like ATP-grasp enzyme
MPMPDSARYARDAAAAIGAAFEDLDEGGGYLFRVVKDGRSVLGGGGNVCAYPVNSATAYTISRDKAHTKTVLASAGLAVIPGGLFFAHKRRAAMRGPGREAEDAVAHVRRRDYPVFCKPNMGSRGTFAEIVADEAGLKDYIARVAVEFETFLIEPVLQGAEHRVVVRDGQPVFHSTKTQPALVGDGVSTLERLLERLNATLPEQGVSPAPLSTLALAGRKPGDIPTKGERVPLPGRRNLSAAGDAELVSTDVAPKLAQLAIAAVGAIGLRFGAVDMFDISAAGNLSQLVVIEVNGNPGLRTLEIAGRSDLIRAIWTSMLKECLSS